VTVGKSQMTPTNVSLGTRVGERLSKFSAEGVHIGGDKPTKEAFLHQCMYCERMTAEPWVIAQYATEELEERSKLFLLLGDRKFRPLTENQRDNLNARR